MFENYRLMRMSQRRAAVAEKPRVAQHHTPNGLSLLACMLPVIVKLRKKRSKAGVQRLLLTVLVKAGIVIRRNATQR